MWYLILSILLLGLLAAILERLSRGKAREGGPSPAPQPPGVCCQQHEICERTFRQTSLPQAITYYNDEELDRFCRIETEAYADSEVEEFRDILYTLRPFEVAGWLHSLEQRRIKLPALLREEALLIVLEEHSSPGAP
ncbi:MAG: phospholipase [Tannerellaceae bacterium]|jgi:hypothetical protein|nr:phospholipase [Tannerellaceae bacterium]